MPENDHAQMSSNRTSAASSPPQWRCWAYDRERDVLVIADPTGENGAEYVLFWHPIHIRLPVHFEGETIEILTGSEAIDTVQVRIPVALAEGYQIVVVRSGGRTDYVICESVEDRRSNGGSR